MDRVVKEFMANGNILHEHSFTIAEDGSEEFRQSNYWVYNENEEVLETYGELANGDRLE
ncbi:MAG: hypothetical protein ACI9O4_001732 [Chitinophagales bacterium]|jgi:hypothetical protein